MAVKINIKGVLYGAIVGDALGVPFEFKSREDCDCAGMIESKTYG